MQFRLPEQLQTELLAYDPKLKALARSNQPKKESKKAKYPLGNVNDLIPTDVINASMLQDAIDNINGNPAPNRYQIFTKVVDVATPEARTVTKAIVYHYEQCWYAVWLPPKGKESEYVYGYAYAYRDNATAWKMIPRCLRDEKESGLCTERKYGRSVFITRQALITLDDIKKSKYDMDVKRWNSAGVASYFAKGHNTYQAIAGFETQLKNTIPTWTDSRGIFDRIRTTQISWVLIPEFKRDLFDKSIPKDWQPSFDSVLKLLINPATKFDSIDHIIKTPFIRRWIQNNCDKSIERFNDPTCAKVTEIKRPWKLITTYLEAIHIVNKVWPDCPIDYYQTNIDVLLGVNLGYRPLPDPKVIEWLRKHMPVSSFFTLLNKFYEQKTQELEQETSQHRRNWVHNETLGRNVFTFTDLMDTFSMLATVLNNGELEPPKRWRIAEFHDYVQAEAWKIKNPNEDLPQDLFPQPVKVDLDGEPWTFFQPHDTHQLSHWGQAVRNCVGSASHYAENCKKKKHFIVLCMINGKPQFTIQLVVDMGLMSVKQIAGIANKSLIQEQRDQYTKAFGMALQSRTEQLSSVA